MAGKKRSSEEAGVSTRSGGAKAVKTSPDSKKGGKKKGPQAMATSAFKSRALPLHVNVTNTPPSIPDDETVPAANADPGFLGTLALQPSTFNTGSYGWKGSKRLVVELPDPEGGESKEKVHVMLTINATVMGSKQAEKDEDGAKEGAEAEGNGEGAHVEETEDAKDGEGETAAAEE